MDSISIWHVAVLAIPVLLAFAVAGALIYFRRRAARREAIKKAPHWS